MVSSLKFPSSVNNPYLLSKSSLGLFVFFKGTTLISVRVGDISCIHNLSVSPSSEPILLFSNVIWVLNIPLEYPASLINLSKSIINSDASFVFLVSSFLVIKK